MPKQSKQATQRRAPGKRIAKKPVSRPRDKVTSATRRASRGVAKAVRQQPLKSAVRTRSLPLAPAELKRTSDNRHVSSPPPKNLKGGYDAGYVGVSVAGLSFKAASISSGVDENGHYQEVCGHDYVGAVMTGSTTDSSTGTVYVVRENTVFLEDSRLSNYAGMFERWRPVEHTAPHPRTGKKERHSGWRTIFVPAQPTSQKGTLVMAHDPDPLTSWTSGPQMPARLYAQEGAVMFPLYLCEVSELPRSSDYTSLWTNDPNTSITEGDRLDLAGRTIVANVAPTGLAAGSVLGMLVVDYKIRFYVPRLSLASSAQETTILHKTTGSGFGTGAFKIPVISVDTAKPILDKIVVGIKQQLEGSTFGVGNAAVAKLLRNYLAKDDFTALVESGNSPEDPTWGWEAGSKMTVSVTVAWDGDETGGKDAWPGGTNTFDPEVKGAAWYLGSPSDETEPYSAVDVHGPDGTAYENSFTWLYDMGSASGRYHADVNFLAGAYNSGTQNPPKNVTWWITIRQSGINTYRDISSASSIAKGDIPKCSPVTERMLAVEALRAIAERKMKIKASEHPPLPAESKDEKATSDEDIEDLGDLFEKRAMPSGAPGGRLYKPSVSSRESLPASDRLKGGASSSRDDPRARPAKHVVIGLTS